MIVQGEGEAVIPKLINESRLRSHRSLEGVIVQIDLNSGSGAISEKDLCFLKFDLAKYPGATVVGTPPPSIFRTTTMNTAAVR